MKCIGILLLLAAISGCVGPQTPQQPAWSSETAQTSDSAQKPDALEAEEESVVENQDAVNRLVDVLGCSERTAQSLCAKLERAISGRIIEIEDIPNEFYRVLKVTSDSGNVFFAEVMTGYFLSNVYADSLDGEVVYEAIQ